MSTISALLLVLKLSPVILIKHGASDTRLPVALCSQTEDFGVTSVKCQWLTVVEEAGLQPVALFCMACCHRQGQGRRAAQMDQKCVYLKGEALLLAPARGSFVCSVPWGAGLKAVSPLTLLWDLQDSPPPGGHTSSGAAPPPLLLADDILSVEVLGPWLPTAG